MTSSKNLRPATAADLLALPDEGRGFEIIDATLSEKPLASGRHGGAQLKVGVALDPYNRRPGPRGPGGWIFGSEVLVQFDPEHLLRPDVAGWRLERLAALPEEPVVTVVPDWVCEILSPSNVRNDTIRKKRVFHRHGVGHYWVLDPMRETLSVYRWTEVAYLEVLSAERGERVRAEPFDAVEFDVGIFFGDDD